MLMDTSYCRDKPKPLDLPIIRSDSLPGKIMKSLMRGKYRLVQDFVIQFKQDQKKKESSSESGSSSQEETIQSKRSSLQYDDQLDSQIGEGQKKTFLSKGSRYESESQNDQQEIEQLEQEYYSQYGDRFKLPPKKTAEEIMQSQAYKLQMEIFQLIKTKIGTQDEEKVNLFREKLNQLQDAYKIKLEPYTLRKIDALLRHKQEIDDQKIKQSIEEQQAMPEPYNIGDQVAERTKLNPSFRPARLDLDSSKTIPYPVDLYDLQMERQLQQAFDHQKDFNQTVADDISIESIMKEAETPEGAARLKKDSYEHYLDETKSEMQSMMDQRRQIDEEYVGPDRDLTLSIENDHTSFQQYYYNLQQQEQIREGFQQDQRRHMENLEIQFNTPPEITKKAQIKLDIAMDEAYEDFKEEFGDIYFSEFRELKLIFKETFVKKLELIQNLNSTKNQISAIKRQRDKLVQEFEREDTSYQLAPRQSLKLNQIISQKGATDIKRQIEQIQNSRNFSINTAYQTQEFNQELSVLSQIYLLQKNEGIETEDTERLAATVVSQLFKKKPQFDIHTKSRLFEYGVMTKNIDLANQNLKDLTFNQIGGTISPPFLEQFYRVSLKKDNFDGLGFLIAYAQKFEYSISSWDLNKFKTALDFYVNKRFNLNNILIFSKYYVHYHDCRLRENINDRSFSSLSEAEKEFLYNQVFAQTEELVDNRLLFSHLVETIRDKEAIDPITKEDSLWQLIDFQFRPEILELSKFAQKTHNTLNPRDVASYLRNHFNGSKTFDRVAALVLRSNEKLPDTIIFTNAIIQHLKEYQTQNGSLPFSFERNRVRNTYIKLRGAAAKSESVRFSDKTLEYFLHIFKSQGMWGEVIDLCDNFNNLSSANRSESEPNRIRDFYLSDALLRMPKSSTSNYHQVVQEAVYNGKEDNREPGFIQAMTKAYFKDGSAQYALKFFQEKVQNLRDIKEQREKVLVSIFDSVYGDETPQKLDYQEFKDKYLDTLLLGNRLMKESYVVSTLQGIIAEKDYNQIDTLFQLYSVHKEEMSLLNSMPHFSKSLLEELGNTQAQHLPLKQEEREYLIRLRERKAVLQQNLNPQDAETLKSIVELMGEDKVSLLSDINSESVEEVKQALPVNSQQEFQAMGKRTEEIQRVAKMMRDKNTETLGLVWQQAQKNSLDALQQSLSSCFKIQRGDKTLNPQGALKYYEPLRRKGRTEDQEMAENFSMEWKEYNRTTYNGGIYDNTDPYGAADIAFNKTIIEMKEQLLKAVDERKQMVLLLTVGILNKMQEKNLKIYQFNVTDKTKPALNETNEIIDKIEVLLNDPRSPINSQLYAVSQENRIEIQGQPLEITKEGTQLVEFEQVYADLEDFFNKRFDLDHYQQQKFKLDSVINEVKDIQQVLKSVLSNLSSYINPKLSAASSDSTNSLIQEKIENRAKQLYEEYVRAFEQLPKGKREFSNEQKLELVRDVLNVEMGGNFASNDYIFPAFYSQDLIIFGIENNIPEAIRLGEHMLSSNGQEISREMQIAVKDYMLTNSQKYHEAMKSTGPIDGASLYRRTQHIRSSDTADSRRVGIVNLDDPYWTEFFERNIYQRTTQWKLPSGFAWDHKKFGILEDIFGSEKLRKMEAQFEKATFRMSL